MKVGLDKEFEYLDNELFVVGFRNVVKKWLKTKRNKLKVRYMARNKDCLINIEPIHWERLKAYWSKHEIERKVKQMSNTRSKVKSLMNVGQLAKARLEARLEYSLLTFNFPP
jgi:hypothetical protein